MQSETVALSPSGSSHRFNVHKLLLEHKCKAVYVACTKFKEKDTGVYRFENVSAGTLVRFIQWAYTGGYDEDVEIGARKDRPTDAKNDPSFVQITPESPEADENH